MGLLMTAGSVSLSEAAPRAVLPELLPADAYAHKVLAAHKGRPTLVSFWATWCTPCRAELPALLSAVAGKPIDLVLVSLDPSEEVASVGEFLRAAGVAGEIYIVAPVSPEDFIRIVDARWDGSVPYTLLYGADGRIAARLSGSQTKATFRRAIAAATGHARRR